MQQPKLTLTAKPRINLEIGGTLVLVSAPKGFVAPRLRITALTTVKPELTTTSE